MPWSLADSRTDPTTKLTGQILGCTRVPWVPSGLKRNEGHRRKKECGRCQAGRHVWCFAVRVCLVHQRLQHGLRGIEVGKPIPCHDLACIRKVGIAIDRVLCADCEMPSGGKTEGTHDDAGFIHIGDVLGQSGCEWVPSPGCRQLFPVVK